MQEETQNTNQPNKLDAQKEKNTGMAIIAYFIFFLPLLTEAKSDPFVRYHVNQGLILFFAAVISAMVSSFPLSMFFSWVLNIAVLVLLIIGILNVLAGKQAPLPIIGRISEYFKI